LTVDVASLRIAEIAIITLERSSFLMSFLVAASAGDGEACTSTSSRQTQGFKPIEGIRELPDQPH